MIKCACTDNSVYPWQTAKKMLCSGLHSQELNNMLMNKVHKADNDLLSDIREFMEVNSKRAERFKTDSRTTSNIRNKPSVGLSLSSV